MSLRDQRDVLFSTNNRRSLARYETAVDLLHGYFNDPLAIIEEALTDDPAFVMGHCLRADMMVMAGEKAVLPALRDSVMAAEALAHTANDRERGHMAAARAWLEGDFQRAVDLYGTLLIDYPRDSLALQAAHVGDFYLGQSTMLRDRIARVLPHWDEHVPGYGYVLGMYAFGLEETGAYGRAEETGRRALVMDRRDAWAVHAVAHVMEMQGRQKDGIDWLSQRIEDWSPNNSFAFHNWWHLGLFYLDAGETDRVLQIYDHAIRPRPSRVVLEMIDATAMLWRLHLRGIDVGGRWRDVADSWEEIAENGHYAFNDAHAMMAFVADGRKRAAGNLMAAVKAAVEGSGTNGMMTREVGLSVCRAIEAFGREDYDTVIDVLMPVRIHAHRFGGSHAQRDILNLTLIEAALRGGRGRLARALAAERTELKPASPFNWLLTARALAMTGETGQAEKARAQAKAMAE
jgi:tetratricopeptide (TPR) repeat protein